MADIPASAQGRRDFDLLRRALVISLGQSVVTALELVSAVVLIRLLAPNDWSSVALALTIYQTGIGVGGLNLQDGIYFFYARIEPPRRLGFVLQTAALLGASGLAAAAIVLGARGAFHVTGQGVGALLPWIALAIAVELPTSFAAQLLVATEHPNWASAFNTAMSCLKLVLLALPLYLGRGVVGSAQGLFAYTVLRAFFCLVLYSRIVPSGKARIDWSLVKEQLSYTLPLALTIASAMLNKYADKWIVAGLAPRDFGAYAFAAQEVPLIPVLGFAMATALATRITHAFKAQQYQRALAYWLAATTRTALVVGPATIGLVLCAPEAIGLLFQPSYAIAVLPFQLYSLILLHRIMGYGLILRAAGQTRALWFNTLLLLSLNVAFCVPLTHWLGITGAALGTLLAYIPNLFYSLYCIARAMQTTLKAVFPWRKYGQILAAALVSAALSQWLGRLVPGVGARLAFKAALFLGSYLVQARGFGFGRQLPSVPEDAAEFS